MLVALTNLSSTPQYLAQFYKELVSGETLTVRRTMAQIDADISLKALIYAGTVGIAYTEEAGDDIAGGGGLEDGVAQTLTVRKTFAAGAGGAPDDVAVFNANAPYAFDILDVTLLVGTAVSLSTCQLRSASGGAGSAQSDALSSATTGTKRNAAATAAVAVAKGASVFLRRSDSGVAGEVLITLARKS
jgi:hypothetical protein